MGSILLKNIQVDGQDTDIHISGNVIDRIFPSGGREEAAHFAASGVEVIDCTGKAAVPGFVNMHTHAGMSLMRGLGEDVVFSDWIERIWDVETKIDAEYVYWATKVACIEMIRTGTTCFNDHYWYPLAGRRAALEMGLRPVVSYVVCDRNAPEEAEREKEQIQRIYEETLDGNENSSFCAAFHAIYSVSEHMIEWIADFARKHGLKLHFHLSETEPEVRAAIKKHGLSPVQYLDRLGVLDENAIAAHTLWLSDEDIEILGRRKVNCVHNINSNLKLASGYMFKYNELRDAGANVCIGTDGCASSNNLDMLEAMKTSAIVQKAWRNNPAAMPLAELMDMASKNGADALGLNTGRIREGALADLLIVDTDNTFFLSSAPFLANFIYSAHSDCIESVICNGRFVMRNKVINSEKEIIEQTRKMLSKLE